MNFYIWIISPDETLTHRWNQAFTRQNWKVSVLKSVPRSGAFRANIKGIALVEMGMEGFRTPGDFDNFLKLNHGISIIAFCGSGTVSNHIIAGCLESGVDDFVDSTIDERVLTAKLVAHIRRTLVSDKWVDNVAYSSTRRIQVDKNRKAARFYGSNGKFKELTDFTPKEFALLFMFVSFEGQVVSRRQILEHLWHDEAGQVNPETVDKHVESLRKKLGNSGKKIKTVYGEGYVFRE